MEKMKILQTEKTRFNIMALGPHGSGKSTFLSSLLQGYTNKVNTDCRQNIDTQKEAGEGEAVQIVLTGSAELNSENNNAIKVFVYESLGYADFINNDNAVETISNYLVNSHANWRDLDAQSMSREEFLVKDERIHCLFYFLSPHCLKEIDKVFLSRVSSIVPIIPIIAKSDTLTILERNFFMREVYDTINKLSGSLCKPMIYKFHGSENSGEVMDSAIISTLKDTKNAPIEVDTDSKRAKIINKIMELMKINKTEHIDDMDPISDNNSSHSLPFDDIPLLTSADAYIIDTTVKRSKFWTETTNHDALFNQETFVNIGQALSAKSPDSDCISVISSDTSSMDDLVMVNSAVLVNIPQCRSDEGATRQNIHDIDNSDDALSFPINPAERMICKIVCQKVCDHIEGNGKEAVCKLVTSVVCEHVGTEEAARIAEKEGNEEITKLVNDLLATYESDDCNTSRTSFTVQDISSLLSAAVPLGDFELASLLLKGAEAELPSVSPLSSLSGATAAELSKPFSLTANGVHIYSNIFAIICGSIESNIVHDGGEIGSINSGGIDGDGGNSLKVMAKEKERLRIYSWGTVDTTDDTHSDLTRLKQLLFEEGSQIQSLIELTRQQSIHLFPIRAQHKPSRIKVNQVDVRDFSNLLRFLDPMPLSYLISIIYSLPSTLSIKIQKAFTIFSIKNLMKSPPSLRLIATFSNMKNMLSSITGAVFYLFLGTFSMLLWIFRLCVNCLGSYIRSATTLFHVGLATVWEYVTFLPTNLIKYYCLQRSTITVDKGFCGKIDEIYSADTFSTEINPTHTDARESELRILLVKRLSKTSVPSPILNCFESVNAFCDECCTANPNTSPLTPTPSPSTNEAIIIRNLSEGSKKGPTNCRGVDGEVVIGSSTKKHRFDAWMKVVLMVLKGIVILQMVFLMGSLPIEFFKSHLSTAVPFQKNILSIFQPPKVFKLSHTDSTKSINIDERSVAYCVDHRSQYKSGAFGCLSQLTDASDAIVSDLHDCRKDLSFTTIEIKDCAKANEGDNHISPLRFCVKMGENTGKSEVMECLNNTRKNKDIKISYSDEELTGDVNALEALFYFVEGTAASQKTHEYLDEESIDVMEELEELLSTIKNESQEEEKNESGELHQQNKVKVHQELLFKKAFRDVKKIFKSMKESLIEAIELLYYVPLATLILLSSSTLAIIIAQLPIVAIHLIWSLWRPF